MDLRVVVIRSDISSFEKPNAAVMRQNSKTSSRLEPVSTEESFCWGQPRWLASCTWLKPNDALRSRSLPTKRRYAL